MKPEIKARWVEALRSGKYEQGRGALRSDTNQFCCLGVLCDLYAKETGEKWAEGGAHGEDRFSLLGNDLVLPRSVARWAGLDGVDPDLCIHGRELGVSGHNDGDLDVGRRPKPFTTIADAIEEQL